ncbi:alpha/beta hydrolase [Allopusillimonas soli]|uniref:Alpha/beta hydrolase n=1 Tax=Allopusillimonas soli TaxID=659016 RepID=A0A853F8J8_9BURK|nr:alpha/beta hydrolase [Allopusillimonas soli]NYT36423.1 alpha/beta hydrolase [Allopusillimonas soli]TEA74934.1 alpha/beta hydrolase [Allopusillimonas soli]
MSSSSRAVLDREYDNVRKISTASFQAIIKHLERQSALASHRYQMAKDLAYGRGALEQLDVFGTGKHKTPVQVFIHGGYWHMLDKRDFGFVANGLVPHGVTVVIVNYPLLPQVRMQGQVAACHRALHWVRDHIADFGGDPEHISLIGHSSGAHIAAMLLTRRAHEDLCPGNAVTPEHACLISGIYDLQPIQECFLNDTLALSDEEVDSYSPIRQRPQTDCPLTIVVGGDEGKEYLCQSRGLIQAWAGTGNAPMALHVLNQENHFTTRAQLNDPSSSIIKLLTRS